ncbi:MAG TPA: T9SS type A sorting domain-containing protein [Bacteroidia bacterium]|nr:T9SS type A sorting domain-containing protein [Bacteroidia bacterium]
MISLLIPVLLQAQGINNLWLMGYEYQSGPPWGGIKMDFTGGILNINQDNRNINLDCTNGLISDSIGNLLFVSNGVYIANAANDTMLNGSGLSPAPFTTNHTHLGLTLPQANLVIPIPDHPRQYYLFHETCDDYGYTFSSFYLYYSIIDMSMDSGLGAVVSKNNILLHDSLTEGRLTACKHANGRDWWLIVHRGVNSSLYYKYLITPFGIDGPYTQSIGSYRDWFFGQCVFSPDGKYYAYYEPTRDLDIYQFDRCTGDFVNPIQVAINDSAISVGVAFSPNSKVLYLSSTNYVYQFDLTASNIAASKTTVAVYDGYYSPQPPFATSFYLSQLAPDGKIYINCGNGTLDIHVINHPDIVGLGCDVCQHCIHLPSYNAFTIPNYPNYFLGSETGTVCDSLTNRIPEINSKINFQFNPNPVTGRNFTITYSALRAEGELQIINLEGKKVAGYPLPEWSSVQHLTLPELAPGIYMARLQSNGATGTIKFLVE